MSIKSLSEKMALARTRLANLETLVRIQNADPSRIIGVVLAGIAEGKDIDRKVLISLARVRHHWADAGKLVKLRSIVDGEVVESYRYLTVPSGTDSEYRATWDKIGDTRILYYLAAVKLGYFMPSETDSAVSKKPLDTSRKEGR